MTNGVSSLPAGASEALPLEFHILDLFTSARLVYLGPTDVQKLTGVSKGTVSPKLKALAEAGYLSASGAGKYQLGGKLFTTAIAYMGLMVQRAEAVRAMTNEQLNLVISAFGQLKDGMEFGMRPAGSGLPATAEPAGGGDA